jgi:circadian clock protein KaiB
MLKLYVSGQTVRALAAFANLKRLCASQLRDHYQVEVIDLRKNPKLATGDKIIAIASQPAKGDEAVANLKRACAIHLEDQYRIEVINLFGNQRLANDDMALDVPSLLRNLPPQVRRIMGELADEERVLVGFDLTTND